MVAFGFSVTFSGDGGGILFAGRFYILYLGEVWVPMNMSNRLGSGVGSC